MYFEQQNFLNWPSVEMACLTLAPIHFLYLRSVEMATLVLR